MAKKKLSDLVEKTGLINESDIFHVRDSSDKKVTRAGLRRGLSDEIFNKEFVSDVRGATPDSSNAMDGTIGLYAKNNGLLQKVYWDAENSQWVDYGIPFATVDNVLDTKPFNGKRVSIVSGVCRYYDSAGQWQLLEDQGEGHPAINIDSVQSFSDGPIRINFDHANMGNGQLSDLKVCSFRITPDEDFASVGLFCGASVSTEKADVYCYLPGQSEYISYDGSEFTAAKSRVSASWATDHLSITRSARKINYGSIGSYPVVHGRETPLHVKMGSVSGSSVEVWFYDNSGNLITSPNSNMKVWFYDPHIATELDPNRDFKDMTGNLWFSGIITSGHS